MLLYRDEYYFEDTEDRNIAEIIVAKNNNGECGKVELIFMGEYCKFVDLEK